jgi:hypothetical protein
MFVVWFLSSRPSTFVEAVDLSRVMYRERGDVTPNESKKIEQFISGLPSDIKRHVISVRPATFRSIVDLSRLLYLERDVTTPTKVKKQGNDKRKRDNHGEPETKKSKAEGKTCEKCGREHLGECRIGTGVCYRCGEVGHISYDCPTLKCDACGTR